MNKLSTFLKKSLSAFKEMITDERGRISSKRFVGLISAFVLWFGFTISLFTKQGYTVDSLLAEIVAFLAFGSLGLTSIDKFGWRNKNKDNNENGVI
jgi:hypothetical protein